MDGVEQQGVKREEKSKPQYVWKDMVLYSLEQTRLAYKKVKTDANYDSRRISAYERDLSEGINDLWGLVGTKVVKRVAQAKAKKEETGYEALLNLDNPKLKPTSQQLLAYYRLFSDFVDDLGITRVEEETFKIASSHKILRGFVKDK